MKYYEQTPIKNWVAEDRPREKMLSKGMLSLTEAELIATLLSSGTREYSAIDLGRKLLEKFGGLRNLARASVQELMQVKGIGKAKATCIVSAFELGRRKKDKKKEYIRHSQDISDYFRSRLVDLDHEQFHAIYLDADCQILGERCISKGGVTSTTIDPRIVFKDALQLLASNVVFCHNHPSGNIRPSRSDDAVTARLAKAAAFFDIKVLDHVILGNPDFYSYADSNRLLNVRP